MRVLVLGGGGAMGAVAARFISQLVGVTGLTVADRQARSAVDTVASLSLLAGVSVLPKAVELNVDNTSDLANAISAHDIVVNAVGPFYRFGLPILRAVISQGRHYVDICDDWEPTIEMLALDEQAQATGSICVVGAGASPGASNMLAVLAARELDEVHDVFTVWPVDVGGDDDEHASESVTSTGEIASAAVVHWMQQISGTIRIVDGGKFVDVPPLEPIAMTFPGYGSGTAYSVGHPEPITLKSSLGVTGRSANAMLITPSTLAFLDGLRHDIDAGKLTNETAALQVEDPSVRRQAKAAISGLTKHGPGKLPLFFALATGLKNGVLMRSGATVNALPSGMAHATSAPAAITVGQLISGKISRAGVHPPERVVDADAFFAALHPYCEQLSSDEPVAVVTTEVISP